MTTPGRCEQLKAEDAARINAGRMGLPLVVIAWDEDRAQSHLGSFRAWAAARPLTWTIAHMAVAFVFGCLLTAACLSS